MVTKEQKKHIIQNNITRLEQEQYDLEIRASVMKKVGDDRYEQVTEQLEKNQKMQDAYKEELEKL